jgi:hypothetical protein
MGRVSFEVRDGANYPRMSTWVQVLGLKLDRAHVSGQDGRDLLGTLIVEFIKPADSFTPILISMINGGSKFSNVTVDWETEIIPFEKQLTPQNMIFYMRDPTLTYWEANTMLLSMGERVRMKCERWRRNSIKGEQEHRAYRT